MVRSRLAIQAELSKLRIRLGLTTISRYLPKVGPVKDPQQRWMTFLRNHRDSNFPLAALDSIPRFGIPPKRTTLQSPWQNGTAERVVDSVRRELLDHVVVLGENHSRRLLWEYVDCYNTERVHTAIGDARKAAQSKIDPRVRPR